MARTQAALEIHLSRDIASIVHGYISPISLAPIDIGRIGHGELCMDLYQRDWPDALEGICEAGYRSLIMPMIIGSLSHTAGFVGACRGGHRDIIEQMIQFGVDAWDLGLVNACRGGHREIVDMMLEYGATNLTTGSCNAYQFGHKEIANYLISRGARKCAICVDVKNHD